MTPDRFRTPRLPRTALLLAGLGAALIFGGLTAARGHASPAAGEPPWVEQQVAEVAPGQVYRLDACFTVTAPGLQFIVVCASSGTANQNGYGSSSLVEDSPADPGLVGSQQCLSLAGADAPCAARSARFGVIAVEDTTAVTVSSLQFAADPAATPVACPTPTPVATPTATPTSRATPAPSPTPRPPPASTPTPGAAAEPAVFPSLVNGGFEELRGDGTPYGWHKVGGEMAATSAVHSEGGRAAALTSRTGSTKWLFQTVGVRGGSHYRLRAMALKDDAAVREALLRVSWYASSDGSGGQLSTADSQPLTADSPRFVALDTGAVQAPSEARSARVRLLLRPLSGSAATVYFDDVSFQETDDAVRRGRSGGERSVEPAAQARPRSPGVASTRQEVAGRRAGPSALANVREPRVEDAPAAAGGGRPLWPVLLALGVPAAGLALTAAHARRSRLAGGNRRHL